MAEAMMMPARALVGSHWPTGPENSSSKSRMAPAAGAAQRRAPARTAAAVPPMLADPAMPPASPTAIWPILWASSSRRALWRRPVVVSARTEVRRVFREDKTASAKAACRINIQGRWDRTTDGSRCKWSPDKPGRAPMTQWAGVEGGPVKGRAAWNNAVAPINPAMGPGTNGSRRGA
jgi:hypothetical protein